MNIMLG